MNHSWNIRRLGDICTSELGKTRDEKRNKGTFRPYLCAINVQWDRFDLSELKEMRFEDDEYDRYTIRKGDLVICEGGDIGRAAIWDNEQPIYYQNALHRVRFVKGIDARFNLYYFMYLKQTGILDGRYGKGVTIKHLVKSTLVSIPVPVPPIVEQQRIVSELDLLADIIDKKNAQLRDLDALAQSIFYEMFGDPNANSLNWPSSSFKDIFKLKSGDGLKEKDFVTGQFPVYGGNGISGYHNAFNKEGKHIIIGRVGAYCGNVRVVEDCFWLTDNAFDALFDSSVLDYYFASWLLNTLDLHRFANHAAQPVISNSGLKDLLIILPPIEIQRHFSERVLAILQQKSSISKSIIDVERLLSERMDAYFS